MLIEDLPEAGTPEWHEMRRRGVGASEVAAACGLSRWTSRYSLWDRKYNGTIWAGNAATRWGQRHEQWILHDWSEETGAEIESTQSTYRDERWPNVWATLDAVATLPDGSECVVEAKSTTSRNAGLGEEGTDQAPIEWLVQVQIQMLLSGIHQARIAVLVDGSQQREYVVEFDRETAERLAGEAQAWYVEASECKVPPASWATLPEMLERIDTYGTPSMVDLRDGEIAQKWADYEMIDRSIKSLEERRDAIKAAVIVAMGDSSRARIADDRELVIERRQRKGFVVNPSSFMVLKAKKVK